MEKETEARGPGRPPVLVDGQQHLVYLDAASIGVAARLGTDGNVSDGARKALARAAPSIAGRQVPPRRSGRGPGLVGGTRKALYLGSEDISVALIKGDGYISLGIRVALREADAEASGRAGAEQINGR